MAGTVHLTCSRRCLPRSSTRRAGGCCARRASGSCSVGHHLQSLALCRLSLAACCVSAAVSRIFTPFRSMSPAPIKPKTQHPTRPAMVCMRWRAKDFVQHVGIRWAAKTWSFTHTQHSILNVGARLPDQCPNAERSPNLGVCHYTSVKMRGGAGGMTGAF